MMTKRFLDFTSLVLFLVLANSIFAFGEEVPPGASSGGNLILGQSEGDPSFDLVPAGGEIPLQMYETGTSKDKITVTADGGWVLTVEDANAATSNYDGKMRRGSMTEVWNYDPDRHLAEKFQVLVQGVGDNSDLPITINLVDATDLSTPHEIAVSSAASTGISIDLLYSQKVEGDAIGAYRIDLTYTLSNKL
jgi:hypothetical protein